MNPQADAPGQMLEEFRAYLRLLGRLQLDERLQSKVDVSGVIQETLLEASQTLDQFRRMSQPERAVWLRAAFVHNLSDAVAKFRTARRDAGREQSLEAAWDDSSARLAAGLAADQSSPSTQAMRHEDEFRVAWALEQLPEDQRMVLELLFWKGCTRVEIAERMQLDRKKVTRLLDKGLNALRILLAERGQE